MKRDMSNFDGAIERNERGYFERYPGQPEAQRKYEAEFDRVMKELERENLSDWELDRLIDACEKELLRRRNKGGNA